MVQPHDELALQYLAEMRTLRKEVEYAMKCITANHLRDFVQSVGHQAATTEMLVKLDRKIQDSHLLNVSSTTSEPIREEIKAMRLELGVLAGEYSALLIHSGRSIDHLALLCESTLGRLPGTSQSGACCQTWFCEG